MFLKHLYMVLFDSLAFA